MSAVVQRDIDRFDGLCAQIDRRNDGAYDQALLSCLRCVMQGDVSGVAEAIGVILSGHRKKAVNDGMKKHFCIPAHALRNLATNMLGSSSSVVDDAIRDHPLWDEEVAAICKADFDSLTYLQALEQLSPPLFHLVCEMPPTAPEGVLAKL